MGAIKVTTMAPVLPRDAVTSSKLGGFDSTPVIVLIVASFVVLVVLWMLYGIPVSKTILRDR